MVTVTMKPRSHLARCLLKLKRKEMEHPVGCKNVSVVCEGSLGGGKGAEESDVICCSFQKIAP